MRYELVELNHTPMLLSQVATCNNSPTPLCHNATRRLSILHQPLGEHPSIPASYESAQQVSVFAPCLLHLCDLFASSNSSKVDN